MKSKDFLLVALVPLALLLIPLVGRFTVEGWNWTGRDFVAAWVILAVTTLLYRLLATRPMANVAYKAGAALAVAAGFLITWISLAVQIIGDDNPGNRLYFVTILGGLVGVGVARFQPAALAKVTFGLAVVVAVIPVISAIAWPADFNPGFAPVFVLNAGFALMFAAAGVLFRRAAGQARESRPA